MARGGGRGVPWTSAERVLEQTLRRLDAAAEGELEAVPADPEARKICNEVLTVAARIAAGGGGAQSAWSTAVGWVRTNEQRVLRVLDRLQRAEDVDALVACVDKLGEVTTGWLPLAKIHRKQHERLRALRRRSREYEYELEDDLIAPWELITWRITVPPSGRGVTKADRLRAQALARRLGATEPIDVGHVTPHVFTRPGDVVRVRPQRRRVNRAEGRDIARAAAARRAAPGLGLPVRPR